jgi:asparagine synthase (glutamine-hydrolysing)
MCGICGIVSARGRVDRKRLAAMSETLVHRGPDSDGTFVKGAAGLAARRLAIIDLESGDQPISNEDGSCTVVQNGEIYNHAELRRELQRAGHRMRTDHSDTETIVHAYEEWDLGFAARLRGMFAVAIWDEKRRRLVLARDRFGIKPLYYRAVDGELSFASELDALPKGDLDLDALESFLATNCVPGPLSIFADIRKLLPGHVLTWENGVVAVKRFARPGPLPVRDDEEAELLEECRARLRDSVSAHLVSDVPVGVLLSGGVDSGTLTAFAAELSSEPVRTFSIGFEETSFNELEGARAVSAKYGTLHRELVLRPDAALLLPALADVFDEPFADSSALPTFLVSRLASEDVKVALSGEGGDELFGGYYTYAADAIADRFGGLGRAARPLVERLPSSTRRTSFDYRAKRFVRAAHLPPLERHEGWKEIFSADARAELTGLRHAFDPLSLPRARFAETEGYELLTRLQDVDLGGYLVDDLLVKSDRASMAWSLETRVPFLDTVVAGFAFSLPARHKVRGLEKKRLLRKAVEPLLPDEVVHGRKRGFSIPAAAWLRGELAPFARETLAPEVLRRQGYLQPDAVTAVIERHVSGAEDLSRQLWGLLSFTLWYERHVEGVKRDVQLETLVKA